MGKERPAGAGEQNRKWIGSALARVAVINKVSTGHPERVTNVPMIDQWPPPGSWLDIAVKFQTAIAAAVGFFGVIITLLINAKKTRDFEIFKDERKKQALISSLTAELDLIKISEESNLKTMQEVDPELAGDIMIPRESPASDIYHSLTHETGLLPHAVVGKVAMAYAVYRDLPRNLEVLAGLRLEESVRALPYFIMPNSRAPAAVRLQRATIDRVNEALEALRGELET